MSNKITKEQLEQVAYKDLLSKFKELGLPEVWKPGKKKAEMIKEALEKLDLVKSLENAGLESQDIEKAVAKVDQQKEQQQRAEELKLAEEKEAAEQKVVEQIVELKLTLPQIQKNLANIEANLKNNVTAQRNTLLLKKAMLMKMIDDKSYQD